MWRKQIVHDDKVNLPAVRHFDSMEAVKLGDEGIRVAFDVLVVVAQDPAEELVFGVVDGLDDVLVVSGKVKEAPTLPGGPQFGQDVFARQRNEVVSRVELELSTQTSKNPRGIVLEFEVVFRRRR